MEQKCKHPKQYVIKKGPVDTKLFGSSQRYLCKRCKKTFYREEKDRWM